MNELDKKLIAPCGMNCQLCIAYTREKNKCDGCNSDSVNKRNHCSNCSIKNCDELKKTNSVFCFNCEKYPCRRLKQLDLRYKSKYGMSMIANLNDIKKIGVDQFITKEIKKWTCKKCGTLYSAHREHCINCGHKNQFYGRYIVHD